MCFGVAIYLQNMYTYRASILLLLQLELVRANCFTGVNMVIHSKCVLAACVFLFELQQCVSSRATDFFNQIIRKNF